MADINLLNMCGIAFLSVFVLLTFLAAIMHLITLAFPERGDAISGAIIAAISSTVSNVYPGSRVIRIEEES